MNSSSLWLALALMLILEGLMPFLSPSGWRRLFAQLLKMNDGQIRFFGLCSMLVGLMVIGLMAWFR